MASDCPKLVLSTVPNIREYIYTKIRFSTPGSAPSCKSDDTKCRSRRQPRMHACTQQQLLLLEEQHACRFVYAGSGIPVHAGMHTAAAAACMHACWLIPSAPFARVFSLRPARNVPFRSAICFLGYFIYQFCIIHHTNYIGSTISPVFVYFEKPTHDML